MMNPEEKARWTAALRSGQYKQGHNKLYSPEEHGHCCLGVWLEVEGYTRRGFDGLVYVVDGYESYQLPPLCWASARGVSEKQVLELSNQNDAKVPFTEIANWIDENL